MHRLGAAKNAERTAKSAFSENRWERRRLCSMQRSIRGRRSIFWIALTRTFFAQVAYRLKVEYGLPEFPLLFIADLFVKLRSGMSLRQISPIRDLDGLTTPMFFIHGKEDTYIPPQMSIDMFKAKQGLKKLYLAPNADHAEAYYKKSGGV